MNRLGKERKRVLVAPLNWGLGHASRMIPVIGELLRQNAEVIIAADGRPLELLKHEFPDLKKIRLPGYDITYQSAGSFAASIMGQVPKIITSYFSEKRAIDKLIEEEKIDMVISDNRYGLHTKKARCVFVTHQLAIRMPAGLKWFEPLLFQLNRHIIERYDECWIPDYGGDNNLSGELTRRFSQPANAKFIGPLTRMKKEKTKKKYDLLFVLSGPEPQRTVLEEILRAQSAGLPLKMLMVRGIFESHEVRRLRQDFEVVDYMTSDRLNEAIQASGLIISRPGYSTVMDLAALGSKAVFIPTPGQTEQEYLAEYLMKRGVAIAQSQKEFSLAAAVKASDSFTGFSQYGSGPQLQTLISRLLRNDVLMAQIHSADASPMISAADAGGG
jgi:uncharacterized protein (TIGR00661 family)